MPINAEQLRSFPALHELVLKYFSDQVAASWDGTYLKLTDTFQNNNSIGVQLKKPGMCCGIQEASGFSMMDSRYHNMGNFRFPVEFQREFLKWRFSTVNFLGVITPCIYYLAYTPGREDAVYTEFYRQAESLGQVIATWNNPTHLNDRKSVIKLVIHQPDELDKRTQFSLGDMLK